MADQVLLHPNIPQQTFRYPGVEEEYLEFDTNGDLDLLVDLSDESLLAQCGYPGGGIPEEQSPPSSESSMSSARTSIGEWHNDSGDEEPSARLPSLSNEIDDNDDPLPKFQRRYRVSSKVMILASPYFKRMLQGHFKEAMEHQAGQIVRVRVERTKTHALEALLAILHNHKLKTFPTPWYEECLELSLLSEMWLCGDAVHFHLSVWFQSLHTKKFFPGPLRSRMELLFQLYIAYRFELPEWFSDVTSTIIESANGKIANAARVEIHHSVFDCMNQQRDLILQKAAEEVCVISRALKRAQPLGSQDHSAIPKQFGELKQSEFMKDAKLNHFRKTESTSIYPNWKTGCFEHAGGGSILSAKAALAAWAKEYGDYMHHRRGVGQIVYDTEGLVSDSIKELWYPKPTFEIHADCALRLADVKAAELMDRPKTS